METHDVTVMKRIGYVLFLIVILLYMFGGSGEAEILDAAENARTILAFGKYEQDNNPDNGPEEIEWIVLEEQDGNLLLLSRYGLDAVPYNDGNHLGGKHPAQLDEQRFPGNCLHARGAVCHPGYRGK